MRGTPNQLCELIDRSDFTQPSVTAGAAQGSPTTLQTARDSGS